MTESPTRVLSLLLAMTADSWALEAALGLGLGWGETWRGTDETGTSGLPGGVTWSQELCLEAEIT